MGGDFVQKQDRRAAKILRQGAGIRQDQADQQRLLLSGRTLVGGHILGHIARQEVGAVRTDERAPGGDVAAAAFVQCQRQVCGFLAALGAGQGQFGRGKGAGGIGGRGDPGDGGAAVRVIASPASAICDSSAAYQCASVT
jgi:hypothetical protein